jgi:uncharacterized protein
MISSFFKSLIICFLVVIFLIDIASAKSQDKKYVIATAGIGGIDYPVGVGIATIASLKLKQKYKLLFSAITSAGSCENINMLHKGEINFAILQGLCGSMAWQGKGKHKDEPKKDLRSITMLWQNVEHFTVLSKYIQTGNIRDLEALYGKGFSIGGRNSAARVSARIIFEALGIDQNKMQLHYLDPSSALTALQQGNIKGMNTPGGIPSSIVCNACGSLGAENFQILEFTKEDLKKVNKNYPIWSEYIIKRGTYPKQKKDICTIAQPNFLVVTKDTPKETVYLLTKTIYDNLSFLHDVHDITNAISLEKAVDGLPMPLHPGAVQFYNEKGINIPQRLLAKE